MAGAREGSRLKERHKVDCLTLPESTPNDPYPCRLDGVIILTAKALSLTTDFVTNKKTAEFPIDGDVGATRYWGAAFVGVSGWLEAITNNWEEGWLVFCFMRRFCLPVGRTGDLVQPKLSDSAIIAVIHKCLPIVIKICGDAPSLNMTPVYFVHDSWLVFPFGIHAATLPVVKCALLEMFPGHIEHDGSAPATQKLNALDVQAATAELEFKRSMAVLKGQLAALEFMSSENASSSDAETQKSDLLEKMKSLEKMKMEQLNELEKAKSQVVIRECHVKIFHQKIGQTVDIAPADGKSVPVRRFYLSRARQMLYVATADTEVVSVKSFGHLDPQDPIKLSLAPAWWWYWAYMNMLSSICKPSSPLPGVFDYTNPQLLNRAGMLDALKHARYDHRNIEERAPGMFHQKTYGDDVAFVEACVQYMNRALFLVCEGNVQFGALKYTADGAPLFDLKSCKGIEDEFKPLHVTFTYAKSAKPKTIYLFDLWKNSALKNFVKKMVWIPWGGWSCSLAQEMDGMDYRCLNRYMGYRYSLKEMADAYNACDPVLMSSVKKVIFNNLCGSDPVQYTYVVKFMARALQLPFCKQGAFLMFVGASGIGKGTIILALGHLLGNSFYHNKAGEVAKDFNSDFLNRSLIFFDEMNLKKDSYSWLKTAITEPTQRIEEKYKSAEDLPSFWSCVGASNDLSLVDSVIDATDRRFFFADCMKTKSPKHAALAESVGRQMSADKYLLNRAFGYWLMNIDISDFDASRIPTTRASKVTQQRSETSAVYMFLAYCLQTKTLLPSPANEFLRLHNYNNEPCVSAVNSSSARYSNGLPADLSGSISITQDDSGVWNPLQLCGERLEKWKRWFRVENDSYLIDLPTWQFMKQRHDVLHPNDSKSLHNWMINGGWLTVVPCAQLYNRFTKWCKNNGIPTARWTSAVFGTMFQEALGPGAIKFHTIGSEMVQFYEIGSHETCHAFFAERFPVFQCVEYEWKTQTEILDPPSLPLTALQNTFVEKLEKTPSPSPLIVDFVTHLKKSVDELLAKGYNSGDTLLDSISKGQIVTLPVTSQTSVAAPPVADIKSHPMVKKLKRKFKEMQDSHGQLQGMLDAKEAEAENLRDTLKKQNFRLLALQEELKKVSSGSEKSTESMETDDDCIFEDAETQAFNQDLEPEDSSNSESDTENESDEETLTLSESSL